MNNFQIVKDYIESQNYTKVNSIRNAHQSYATVKAVQGNKITLFRNSEKYWGGIACLLDRIYHRFVCFRMNINELGTGCCLGFQIRLQDNLSSILRVEEDSLRKINGRLGGKFYVVMIAGYAQGLLIGEKRYMTIRVNNVSENFGDNLQMYVTYIKSSVPVGEERTFDFTETSYFTRADYPNELPEIGSIQDKMRLYIDKNQVVYGKCGVKQ